jgi:hypothetical protein
MLDVKLLKKDGLCLKEVEERDPNLENVLNVERDTKKGVLKKRWVVKDVKEVEKVAF